jgi:hypothetical protein
MNDWSETAEILLEILKTGLLRIRALAWSEDAKRCAVEADHLHNLPYLLAHCDADALAYDWDVERALYMDQTESAQLVAWEPLWRRLQTHVEEAKRSVGCP